MTNTFLLGLDGGGTKTELLLCDPSGRIISHYTGGPSSVTGQSVESARDHLQEALDAVTAPIGGRTAEIAGFFAGISGGGLRANRITLHGILAELLPNVRAWDNASDSVNALSAGIGTQDGTIAIAGTGSSVFGRKDGVMHQVGGWGYLVGDEGSGFDLGRRALVAALRAHDGRTGPTLLKEMCEEKAGVTLTEFIPILYRQDAKAVIASYAPLLLEAARQGDQAALEQLSQATGDMALAIQTAFARAQSMLLVMGGSIWKNELYRQSVRSLLPEETQMIAPELPPVYGSVLLAASLAGVKGGEVFEHNLKASWKEEMTHAKGSN